MRLIVTQEARQELRDAAAYYSRQRKGLGREFRDAVKAAFRQIREWPTAWPPVLDHYRQYQTARFPYGVVYRIEGKMAVVVAVAHLNRELGYWRERIERESES